MKVLGAAIGLAYPFLVYVGLGWLSARSLALVIGGALLVRWLIRLRGRDWRSLAPLAGAAAATGVFLLVVVLLDDGRYLRTLPVVVNLGLFVVFTRTLVAGPPMIERFARIQHTTLPVGAPAYCRRVTVVWSTFFALNALVILWLAVGASLAAWTVYTGIISYLLAGTLFAIELVYRAWRFRHYEDGPVDALLRRIFPPRVGV